MAETVGKITSIKVNSFLQGGVNAQGGAAVAPAPGAIAVRSACGNP